MFMRTERLKSDAQDKELRGWGIHGDVEEVEYKIKCHMNSCQVE